MNPHQVPRIAKDTELVVRKLLSVKRLAYLDIPNPDNIADPIIDRAIELARSTRLMSLTRLLDMAIAEHRRRRDWRKA